MTTIPGHPARPTPPPRTFKPTHPCQGYAPTKPLTWSDLPTQPFASVKDPALTGGAYRITAKLPSDRTGHQVLYTIWQNSSTPDTYYSCSDVVFPQGANSGGFGAAAAPRSESPSRTPDPTADPAAGQGRTGTAPARTTTEATDAPSNPDSTPVASTETADSGPSAPLMAGGAAAVLVLTGGAALAMRLRRR